MTGAAGLSYSDGNSESVAYSVQVLASHLDDKNETYLGADYFYAEDGGATSTDRYKFFAQQNRRLNERWHVGGFGSWSRDDIAGLDRRIEGNILLGYRILDSERATLVIEGGPGYAWEKQGGISRDFATFRLAERFEYRFTETTKLWQSLSWTPKVKDPSDNLIHFELGLETRLTDRWALRTFVQHRTDTSPAPGRGRTDTSFIAGVAYDLGGLGDPEEGGGRRSLFPGEEEDAPKKEGWASTAAIGFSLNKGNADSMGAKLDWNTAYRSADCEFFFDLSHHYAENNGSTSQDRTSSRVQFNRYLSERFYVGPSIRYLRDGAADIDYRVAPTVVAGYSLIKNDATRLALEFGPSYTFEKVGRRTRDYASLVAAERFSHTFNSRVSLEQAVVYTSELSDFDNFDITATAALDTRLSGRMYLRVGAEYAYENRPAALREHHDLGLFSSVAVKF
ncbi:hypothetical protein HAHE_24080 [Haloferula helveola]|uniref:Uncharacterized protein n=2 Tax=Haloferula helveola TaxID=490095 RepID=A0ABN6HAJ3_9BACT|nr:hypothetical protein HAHE_24080 [Haloferula helveola]